MTLVFLAYFLRRFSSASSL